MSQDIEVKDLSKALVLAALAFQGHLESARKDEQAERALKSEEELEEEDEEYPEEMSEEDFLEAFMEFIESEGLETYVTAKAVADAGKRLEHILSRA